MTRTNVENTTENVTTEPESLEVAKLHADLHELSMNREQPLIVRRKFREQLMEIANLIGIAHLRMDSDGYWQIDENHVSGKIPARDDFIEKFSKNCQTTIQRNAIQIESFLGLKSFYAPIQIVGSQPEVLLVLAKNQNAAQLNYLIEIFVEYFSIWLRESRSTDSGWKLTSLAALVELVSKIESCDTVQDACETTVNELLRYLPCEHVAIGLQKRGRMRLRAISGQAELDPKSRTSQTNETALAESHTRDELGVYPPTSESNAHLLLAHRQLATENHLDTVISTPLNTTEEVAVGSILFAGNLSTAEQDKLQKFVNAAAPRIANALEVVRRAQITKFGRAARWLSKKFATSKGQISLAVVAVCIGSLFIPVTYHVRCNCVLDATVRRYCVSPFDGLVEKSLVQPGELVEKGDLLAKMDGQEIHFKMANVTADLARSRKQSEIELNRRNIPKSIVSDLEAQSLSAEKQLLEFQNERIEIRSPVNGMILDGSLEQADGASVEIGEVLFEVGPLDKIDVDIFVPAEEIGHISIDQPIRVWIDGFEAESFTANVEKISPRSELRDAKNVFVATVTIDNTDGRLRPGMKGNVRLDCDQHMLGWNLFHKPWNFLVSRLTWW